MDNISHTIAPAPIFGDSSRLHGLRNSSNKEPTIDDVISKYMSIDLDFNSAGHRDPLDTIYSLRKVTRRRKKGSRPNSADQLANKKGSQKTIPRTTLSVSTKLQPDTSQFRFLDLPQELRDLVYLHLFAKAKLYYQANHRGRNFCTIPLDFNTNIQYTCKQLHTETQAPFFNSLVFIFGPSSGYTKIPPLLPKSVLSRIKSLELIRSEGVWFSNNLLDLTQLPSLEKLTFRTNSACREQALLETDFAIKKDAYLKSYIHQKTSWINARVEQSSRVPVNAWIDKVITKKDRTFAVICEHEIGMGPMERKDQPHEAQYLSQVLLVTADVDKKEPPIISWLSAHEFKHRNECFLRLEELECDLPDSRYRLPTGYLSAKLRLRYMQYHEMISHFLSTSRASMTAIPVKVTDSGADLSKKRKKLAQK